MIRIASLALGLVYLLTVSATVRADGPADNTWEKVRPIPPLGITLTAEQIAALEAKRTALRGQIDTLRKRNSPAINQYLPDVEIFDVAVEKAVRDQEFFGPEDIGRAEELLKVGQQRAEALLAGNTPWTEATGLVVRGFRSKLDGTVQPYGAVVPASYRKERKVRCDIWCHGRGEKMVELQFIDGRMKSIGEIAPADTIVIHPFGRYCNANKLAGEVDTLEALAHAQSAYSIDPDRIAMRGFSMGGAAAWHLAMHYPDRWFAATPGAGFSETPDFLRVFQHETLNPPWYEEVLWQLYDGPVWVRNFSQVPTMAYSGELDIQKQAADIMVAAGAKLTPDPLEITHLIGKKTGHSIHPEVKVEIERRLAILAQRGRERTPSEVDFTTCTLKYNRHHWLTIDRLEQHWKPSRVEAAVYEQQNITTVSVNPTGVTGLTIHFDADQVPPETSMVTVQIPTGTDSPMIGVPRQSDRSFHCRLVKTDDGWKRVLDHEPDTELRKRHDLQGPIDDAFLDAFLFVVPSSPCQHPAVEQWTQAELERAKVRWRRQMRGEVRVRNDGDVTQDDINRYHLILWGDVKANRFLAKIADKLPITQTASEIRVGGVNFDSANHVPLLIHPNPLNPDKYVVLNSGFTYREYDDLNNARQVPKLPDWAIVDVSTPPNARYPGKVVLADFFDERWQLRPQGGSR